MTARICVKPDARRDTHDVELPIASSQERQAILPRCLDIQRVLHSRDHHVERRG